MVEREGCPTCRNGDKKQRKWTKGQFSCSPTKLLQIIRHIMRITEVMRDDLEKPHVAPRPRIGVSRKALNAKKSMTKRRV